MAQHQGQGLSAGDPSRIAVICFREGAKLIGVSCQPSRSLGDIYESDQGLIPTVVERAQLSPRKLLACSQRILQARPPRAKFPAP